MNFVLVLLLLLQLLVLTQCQYNEINFNGCDVVIPVQKEAFLRSPYYPENYAINSACRYKIVAPLDHYIEANCNLTFPYNSQAELFFITVDGNFQLNYAEVITKSLSFTRKSLFRELTLAYASRGNSGKFHCHFLVKKQDCDCGWTVSRRIMNGENAAPLEFPSMVALKDKRDNSRVFCGGSIIAHRYILSAAQCFNIDRKANFINAIVGVTVLSSGLKSPYAAEHDIEQIIAHPYYKVNTNFNDIALLKTTQNIEWSRGVGPICLPPLSSLSKKFSYNFVDLIGWGSIYPAGPTSNQLKKIQLKVIENNKCQAIYNAVTKIYDENICTTDHMQKYRDSCSYDSGGPVILRASRMFLVGCIRLGYGYGCGQKQIATGVNTRITYYVQWIMEKTQYTTCVVQMH